MIKLNLTSGKAGDITVLFVPYVYFQGLQNFLKPLAIFLTVSLEQSQKILVITKDCSQNDDHWKTLTHQKLKILSENCWF